MYPSILNMSGFIHSIRPIRLFLFEAVRHEAHLCFSRHYRGALLLSTCRAERALDKLLTSLAPVIS